jgi:hypothetical protein
MAEEKDIPAKIKQVPSVGRVVHYVAYGTPGGEYAAGAHRAAIVAEVIECTDPAQTGEWLNLMIVNPTGIHFNKAWNDEIEKKPGTWHWPEFVPGRVVPQG